MMVRTARFAPPNLQFRLTCVVVVLVLAASVLVTLFALTVAERDMKGVIGDQQFALLSSAAAFIDDRLEASQQQMVALAGAMPALVRSNPDRLQDRLEDLATSQGFSEFRNLGGFARDGRLLASLRAPAEGQALNAAGRQYFEETLARKRGIVSAPFLGRLSGEQVVLVTAPVFDTRGEVAIVLAGSVELRHANFLRQIDALKPGKTGYLFLMTQDGILIDHPVASRVLKHVGERGLEHGTQRALAGFEGWIESRDQDGSACIYAYKRLRSTGWILAARYPSDEAFAPLIRLRHNAAYAAFGCAAIAGLLAWFTIYRLLAPLEALRSSVSAMRRDGADIGVLQLGRNDEIGELGRAFHDLMAERERALARTRVIADGVPAVIAYVNREQRYEFTNAHYQEMLGKDPETVIGKTIREALGARRYAWLEPNIRAVLHGERVHFEQAAWVRGRRVYHMVDYIPDVSEEGEVSGFFVLVMDISQRKQAELAQAASEKRLRLITDNLPVLIAYIDPEHRFGQANATFEKWFGVARERVAGMHLSELMGAEAYRLARARLDEAFAGASATFEMKIVARGQVRVIESTYIPDVQPDGRVAGVYALTHDMTRVKEAEEKLRQLARIDTLTGIANRRMFGEALHAALERARRHGKALALAYLDIDHFKKINDSYGHGVGDEVLKEFARRLAGNVRATDMAARLSGDEFVIILEDIGGAQEAAAIGEKIVEAVRVPFATGQGELAVTASVGIALSAEGQEHEQLLAAADDALYAAKRKGRDGYVVG